jgi:hypothetical protein
VAHISGAGYVWRWHPVIVGILFEKVAWPGVCTSKRPSGQYREGSLTMKSLGLGLMILVISLCSLGAAYAQDKDNMTACKNLAKYMLEARKIIHEFEASERAHRLLELKRSYSENLGHAPDNARRAAAQWIGALNRADNKIKSGKMEDSAVFDVVRFRNRALSACGMTPEEAGF